VRRVCEEVCECADGGWERVGCCGVDCGRREWRREGNSGEDHRSTAELEAGECRWVGGEE